MPLPLSVLPTWFASWGKAGLSNLRHRTGVMLYYSPRILIRVLNSPTSPFLKGKMGVTIFYFIGSKTLLHFNISALREHFMDSWLYESLWMWLLVLSLRGRVFSRLFLYHWCEFRLQWMSASLLYKFSGEFLFPPSRRSGIGTYKVCSYLFLHGSSVSSSL